MIYPTLLDWSQQCFCWTAPYLVEFSRSNIKTTQYVFYKEELCRALLQCLSLWEQPENRIWLELWLFSRAKFTASLWRPALDPFHRRRNFSPLLWRVCHGFPCSAQEHSALLPRWLLSPWSLLCLSLEQAAPCSHIHGWGGRSKLSFESEWPSAVWWGNSVEIMKKEGKAAEIFLYPLIETRIVILHLWGVRITEIFWRWCTNFKALLKDWKHRRCSWWVSSKTAAFGGIWVTETSVVTSLQLNQF